MLLVPVASQPTLPRCCLIVAYSCLRWQQMHNVIRVSLANVFLEFSVRVFVAHEFFDMHILVLWAVAFKRRKLE